VLREAWDWLTTPCPPWARRAGLLSESVAIQARARRCAAAWAPHQARCCDAIRAAVRPGETVAILGSGPCGDVPLEDLAGRGARVRLVDAVHPWAVRRRVRRLQGIQLITADLTGCAAVLADGAGPVILPTPVAPDWQALGGACDLAISVCVLSQLAPLALARAWPRGIAGGDEAAARFTRDVVWNHLRLLASAPRMLLLSDLPPDEPDPCGHLGLPRMAWGWAVAPPGEDGPLPQVHPVRVWARP
jgi:hypothetical protein